MFSKSETTAIEKKPKIANFIEHPECEPVRTWTVYRKSAATAIWLFIGQKFGPVWTIQDRGTRPKSTVHNAIESAKWILDLPHDFDDEGAEPYSKETWERATAFLTHYAAWVSRDHGVDIPIPRIRPGPDGSIDLRWKTDTYELLLNFPKNPNEMATYYGEDESNEIAEGKFKQTSHNVGLVTWFVKHK